MTPTQKNKDEADKIYRKMQETNQRKKARQKFYEQVSALLMDNSSVRAKSTDVIQSDVFTKALNKNTVTVEELRKLIAQTINQRAFYFLESDFAGQYLSAGDGGGWKTGRLRITIEFVAEEDIEKGMRLLEELRNEESSESIDELKKSPPDPANAEVEEQE